jgi:hypothetical protein
VSSKEEIRRRSSDTSGHRVPGVLNLSGAHSPNMIRKPRDAGGATDSDVPGTGTEGNRRPIQIDAVTGQEFADAAQAELLRAAAAPLTRWPSLPAKRQAMRAAVDEVAGDAPHAGELGEGSGLLLGAPEPVIRRVFGLD